MRQDYLKLKAFFTNGRHPSVKEFNAKLALLPKEEQRKRRCDTYRIAFGYWNKLPRYYREFFIGLAENNREAYVDFIRTETLQGSLLYPLKHPELVIQFFKIVEGRKTKHKMSYRHQAASLCIGFDYTVRVVTLARYIRQARLQVEKALQLIGKKEVDCEDDY